MATTFEQTTHYDIAPDHMLRIISSPEFEKEQVEMQESNKSCEIREVSRSDDRLVYEVHTEEYAKGLTGIDKSKTEHAVTTTSWSLGSMASDWTYKGAHGDKVKVWGVTRITPDGDGSLLYSTFNVKVGIPLVGGKIEKMVISEVKKFWPSYERLIRQFAAR